MVYRLKTVQNLPITPAQAWDFLSDPKNLKTITPDYMGFKILEGAEDKMYAGQIIKYIVRCTGNSAALGNEITHVEDQILWMSSVLGHTAFGITNIL